MGGDSVKFQRHPTLGADVQHHRLRCGGRIDDQDECKEQQDAHQGFHEASALFISDNGQ